MKPSLLLLLLFLAIPARLGAQDDAFYGRKIALLCEELHQKNLKYLWASDDPAKGGLDCSGVVRHIFREVYGVDLPDESGLQYEYLKKHGQVWDARSKNWSPLKLQTGDLIFITGTYKSDRVSPITHVVIYINEEKIFGAQDMGKRIDYQTPGVGFFRFKPLHPVGYDGMDETRIREKPHLYSYGRFIPSAETVKKQVPNLNKEQVGSQ
ncbi:MAG: NlpC/P60 family protein [Verrucomicrobiae bacterium]|nr:NlpC/P60 family protein [Verrucomicrobiae bacterium]